MPPIGLITDFGDKDHFVGTMKGAILSVNPEANVIDITHKVPKHDVLTASFVLVNASETFPENSIFVVVVDPGVGTERKCILLRTENGLNFIGPDNGVFTLIAEKYGSKEIREISNKEVMRSEVSSTFHGRDIMAPAAAHLSKGFEATKVGPRLDEMKLLEIDKPRVSKERIFGKIIHIDDFGNLITNIEENTLKQFFETGDTLKVNIGGQEFEAPFLRAFGEAGEREILSYIGSVNKMEIGKNQGNLAGDLKIEKNSNISVKIPG